MHLPVRLERMFHRCVDAVFRRLPQPHPGHRRLQECRIVSHRGDHDNRRIFENTIAAFDAARAGGTWGVELDLRWTRDLVPVVHHDAGLGRIFGRPARIRDLTMADLRREFPMVPAMAEVVARYGGKMHLMVEIKAENYPDPDRQNAILRDCFSSLHPCDDYHFLSLVPEMFDRVRFVSPETFLPVAETNLPALSRLARKRGYGGINGHYLLVTRRRIRMHRRSGQSVGTGYVCSKNCLFRELNRGVRWIYSNHGVQLQRILDRCRDSE
jgi:glycerophosphoryl diester phosphodiesterase